MALAPAPAPVQRTLFLSFILFAKDARLRTLTLLTERVQVDYNNFDHYFFRFLIFDNKIMIMILHLALYGRV